MRRQLLWLGLLCTIWGWYSLPFVAPPPDNFRVEIRVLSTQMGESSLSLCREPDCQVVAEVVHPVFLSNPERLSGKLPVEIANDIWTDLTSATSGYKGGGKLKSGVMDHCRYDLRLVADGKEVGNFSSVFAHGDSEMRVIEAIDRAEGLVREKLRTNAAIDATPTI